MHLGPVTALCEAGGHMFSAAHDMGLIAWHCPQNLRAKTSVEFKHVSVGIFIGSFLIQSKFTTEYFERSCAA